MPIIDNYKVPLLRNQFSEVAETNVQENRKVKTKNIIATSIKI